MASIQRTLSQPLRGVNLGGWLVLEKWMTPRVFAGTNATDEYTFCRGADALRRQALRHFRDTFITEADFAWLAAHGIQAVRLPVGYWVFGAAEPYVKTVQYVDKAFVWAEKHGLKILLDLHGAPGSQNGNDHSGQAGVIGWLTQSGSRQQTLDCLERLAKRYGQHSALLGIELLNEPSPTIDSDTLEAFYRDALKIIKPLCAPHCWLLFSDAFQPENWYKRLPFQAFGACVDYHHYQLFGSIDTKLPIWMQIWRARYSLPKKLRSVARHHPLIIGEWSLGLKAEKLAGKNATQRNRVTRRYAQAQVKAFKQSDAWFFWSYKTEMPGPWSFRDCLEQGLLDVD